MSITPTMLAEMRAEIAPVKTRRRSVQAAQSVAEAVRVKPMRTGHRAPERVFQEQVIAFFNACLPASAFYWATPNGQKRSFFEQAEFKALGGRAGIPDLFVAYSGRVIGIELKAANGRVSGNQLSTGTRLFAAGVPVVVCRSVEQVQTAFDKLGIPLRGRIAA